MKYLLLILSVALIGCNKEEGYTLKKYHYKVTGYGFRCDAILTHDGKTIDLNQSTGAIEFDSRNSFEVTFTPNSSNHYDYELYVERNGTWHQHEVHSSFQDGYYSTPKTYIVK